MVNQINHIQRPVRPGWMAEQLGVSHATIYNGIRRGHIEAVRVGKNLFIPWREAQRLLGVPRAEEWRDFKCAAANDN